MWKVSGGLGRLLCAAESGCAAAIKNDRLVIRAWGVGRRGGTQEHSREHPRFHQKTFLIAYPIVSDFDVSQVLADGLELGLSLAAAGRASQPQ